MGTTIKAIQRVDKVNKKGLAPIMIRITENRNTRMISTGVSIPIKDWDIANQCIHCSSVYAEKQFIIDRIKADYFKVVVLEEAKVLERSTHSIKQTVEERFNREIDALVASNKIGTSVKYRGCLSLLTKAGLNKVKISAIDRDYLEKFTRSLIKKGNCSNSIATKLSVLRAVWNKAKNDGIRMPDSDPFLHFNVGKYWKQTKKRALRKEEILRIKEYSIEFDKNTYSMSFARDIFLFSYYEGGINFTDIAQLKPENICLGVLCYARSKTSKEMCLILKKEAMNIIETYRQDENDINQYLFPILDYRTHVSEQQIFNRIHKVLGNVNKNLHQIENELRLSTELTTYVARHSFATVLKRSGVSVEIISECLGHSDIETTQIYLDSFENEDKEKALQNLL